MRRKIVAGNWKLHGSRAFATELVAKLAAHMPLEGIDVVILPPLPYLGDLIEDFEAHHLSFGAQDVSSNEKGAYTGEVSASMLVDVGAGYGLVGHSERRQYHQESSELVARKFAAAIHAGLTPVLCVGESLEQREAVRLRQSYVPSSNRSWRWSAVPVSRAPCWPMNRSGPLAPAVPPRRSRPRPCTPSCVAKSRRPMLESLIRCPSCTGAVSSPITPASCLHSPMSMAGWSEALHWSPKISWPSHARRPRANPLSFVRGRISKC